MRSSSLRPARRARPKRCAADCMGSPRPPRGSSSGWPSSSNSIEQVDAVAAAIADSMRRQDSNSQTITSNTGSGRKRRARGCRGGEGRCRDDRGRQAGGRSRDQGLDRSRSAGRRPEVCGGAVHRDDRKDRRMTMASMPGRPADAAGAALCDPLLSHAGEGVSLADRRAGGVHGLVGRDRKAAQRRRLVGHAVHAAQDHRRHHAGRGAACGCATGWCSGGRCGSNSSRRVQAVPCCIGCSTQSLSWFRCSGWAGISDFGSREILPGFTLPAIWPERAGYADVAVHVPRLSGVRPAGAGGAPHRHCDAGLHDARRRSEGGD